MKRLRKREVRIESSDGDWNLACARSWRSETKSRYIRAGDPAAGAVLRGLCFRKMWRFTEHLTARVHPYRYLKMESW